MIIFGSGAEEGSKSSTTVPSIHPDMLTVQVALALADSGFHIFPVDHPSLLNCAGIGKNHDPKTCIIRGKHPCVLWTKDATTDRELIVAAFQGEMRNIGIHCGRSGVVVIDEDKPGEFQRYAEERGFNIPTTFTVKTGKGLHYYFVRRDDHDLGNREGEFTDYNINIRGGNGYVVGPGSLHATGAWYTVEVASPPAPIPQWVIEGIEQPSEVGSATQASPTDLAVADGRAGLDALPEVITGPNDGHSGGRHQMLMAYGSSLRSRSIPIGEARVLFRSVWERCEQPPICTTPLPWTEANNLLDDVFNRYPEGRSAEQTRAAAALDEAYEHEVAKEVRRIKIRAEARALLAAERARPAEPFDAGTLDEILDRPPVPEHRIEDLVPWEASTEIVAQRKTGKTTLELNMARSLLTGEDFLGRFGVRPLEGDVAFLNFEVSAGQLGRWAYDIGVPGGRFHQVNLRGRRNPLSDPEDRERLAALLRARGVEAIMVDPFGRAFTGNSQNDAGEVQSFLVGLDLFARTEVGAKDVILSAHAGWNGERTRGSSALEDWADSIIKLRRDKDEESRGERYLSALGRDVEVEEDQLLYDESSRSLTMAGVGSLKQVRSGEKIDVLVDVVVGVVTEHPGFGTNEVRNRIREKKLATGFQDRDINKALTSAEELGRIRTEHGGTGQKSPHFPVLTPTDAN